MISYFKKLDFPGKFVLIYLVVSTLGAVFFFSRICSVVLLYGAGLCLGPSIPWIYFSSSSNTSSLIVGSIVGLMINIVIIYLINWVIHKITSKKKWVNVLFILSIALFIFIISVASISILQSGYDCGDYFDPDACYYSVAIDNNNTETCNKIIKEDSRNRCIGSIVGKIGLASACDALKASARDDCYYKVSRSSKHTRLCDNITNSNIRDRCYINQSYYSTDLNICENVSLDSRDRCYYQQGIGTKNHNLCGKISKEYEKENCYYSVAIETNDHKLCNLSKDKDDCYSIIGYGTGDVELCESIELNSTGPANFDRMWNNCIYGVANVKKDATFCLKLKGDDEIKNCQDIIKSIKLRDI